MATLPTMVDVVSNISVVMPWIIYQHDTYKYVRNQELGGGVINLLEGVGKIETLESKEGYETMTLPWSLPVFKEGSLLD